MARGVPTAPIRIVKGLDLPIAGAPEQVIEDGPAVSSVALLGGDYSGVHFTLRVEEGDTVRLGQALFADRRRPEIVFTAPGAGVVRRINRGARRALLSVVVELSGEDGQAFDTVARDALPGLDRARAVEMLLASGLWTAIRTRPYGNIADPTAAPSSIFVTAMDTDPLAPDADVVIPAAREAFADGLAVIARLTDGPVFVCHAPGTPMPDVAAENVSGVAFSGPHPAGLVGTHIHYLDPVAAGKTVWHLGYQDVIAIGRLFVTGRLAVERVVSLAGPGVVRPRLVRTRLGASLGDLTRDGLHDFPCRVISGSVLSGRHARGAEAFLGRFHHQVAALGDGPSNKAFTTYSLAASGAARRKKFPFTTDPHGRAAPLLPLGGLERVMPLDILPTQLVRALMVGDTATAQALGCLELVEEDLALCSFVCPSKQDYGALLRTCLERVEKEG